MSINIPVAWKTYLELPLRQVRKDSSVCLKAWKTSQFNYWKPIFFKQEAENAGPLFLFNKPVRIELGDSGNVWINNVILAVVFTCDGFCTDGRDKEALLQQAAGLRICWISLPRTPPQSTQSRRRRPFHTHTHDRRARPVAGCCGFALSLTSRASFLQYRYSTGTSTPGIRRTMFFVVAVLLERREKGESRGRGEANGIFLKISYFILTPKFKKI